jgi:hypothetical protein
MMQSGTDWQALPAEAVSVSNGIKILMIMT